MASEPFQEILAHKEHVSALAFSPDGGFLVSGGGDGLVKLWRAGEWELFSTFFGHRGTADALSFDPEGSLLATSSIDRTVRIWSFPFGREERVEEGLASAVISPDGATVASLEDEDRIRLWSLDDGEASGRLDHEERVTAMAFEPDGRHLVAGVRGSAMVRWELADPPREVERSPIDGGAAALRFLDEGRRLAASGREAALRVYATDGWEEVVRVELEGGGAHAVAVAPEEEEMAVGTDRGVQVFGAKDGTLRGDLEPAVRGVRAVTYSPDGKWLAAAGADERIRIWEREELP